MGVDMDVFADMHTVLAKYMDFDQPFDCIAYAVLEVSVWLS